MIKQMKTPAEPPHIAALPAELRRLNGILPPMPPPSGIIDALARWNDQHADILAQHADRKVSRHLDDWLNLTLYLAHAAERQGLDPAPLVQMHADGQSLALGRFAPAPPPLTNEINILLTMLLMRAKHAAEPPLAEPQEQMTREKAEPLVSEYLKTHRYPKVEDICRDLGITVGLLYLHFLTLLHITPRATSGV